MAGSTAEMVRRHVRQTPAGGFIRSIDVPGSRAGVHTALSRLSADGKLVRVRHGLYWKGVESRFGAGRPGLLDAGIAAAGGRGAGPSGWSATQALGLSSQIPAVPEIAVAGPVPTFDGVKFHKRNNLARRELSVLEIALLEALRAYPSFADVSSDELASRVGALAAEGKVRLAQVEAAARCERSPAVRRNLAAIRRSLPEDVFA